MKTTHLPTSHLLCLLLFALTFTALLSGCSDDDVSSLLPNVSLSVSALNFKANVDTFEIQTVTISNLTSENVTIERVTSTNPEFFKLGGYYAESRLYELATPFTIEGKGARTLYIGFYPREGITYSGKIIVESLNRELKTETDLVTVTGEGVVPTAE